MSTVLYQEFLIVSDKDRKGYRILHAQGSTHVDMGEYYPFIDLIDSAKNYIDGWFSREL